MIVRTTFSAMSLCVIFAFQTHATGADKDFSSDLPVIIIDAHGQPITNRTRIPAKITVIGTKEGRATLSKPAEYTGKASVGIRGNSSAIHPKKPYRVELQGDKDEDLKVPLLGMPSEADWILHPSYTDKTFLRDPLAHALWKAMGHYAVRTRYVELFIVRTNLVPQAKGASRNEHFILHHQPGLGHLLPTTNHFLSYEGIYVLTEKIKRGKERVDIHNLKPKHDKEPEITGGYIFKKDRVNPGEEGFKSSQGVEFAFEEPKESEITPAQSQYLTNYVNEFERVLFSENFRDPTNGYRKYIDVDSFVDYHWMLEATRNIDGYWFSQFFHKERGGKLKAGPIWDFDLSCGNAFYHEGHKTNGWRWGRMNGQHYKWYDRLFDDPDFLQRYIDRWSELRTNVFATSNVLARIDRLTNQVYEAQTRNYERWPTLGEFVHPNWFIGKTYEEEVGWLKQWIVNRLAWIDTQGFPAPQISLIAGEAGKQLQLKMTCLTGRIYYTLDGSDPRLSGGAISPTASEYGSPIRIAPSARIVARVRSEDGLWSPPATITGTTDVPSGIKVSKYP